MSLAAKRKRSASDDEDDTAEYSSSPDRRNKRQKQKGKSDINHWALEDQVELLKNVHSAMPKHDTQRYAVQTNRLDWSRIAFSDFTADQCKKRFTQIIEKVRRNQTLTELLASADDLIKTRPQLFIQDDADMPKKPIGTFFLFLSDQREKLRSKHPDLSNPELMRLLSEKYNNLSERKKAKYCRKAKAAKDEYDKQMLVFKKDHPELDIKRKEAFSDAPKMPTPVFLYMERKLKNLISSNPESSVEELRVQCRAMWTQLKSKKKLKWIKKAAAAWPQFVEEMDAYCKENPNFPVRFHSLFTLEEQHLKDTAEGKPEKAPSNGFYLFMQEAKQENDGGASLQLLRTQWKNLTNLEKLNYSHQAKKAQAEYIDAYAEYCNQVEIVDYTIGKKNTAGSSSDGAKDNEVEKESLYTALKTDHPEKTSSCNNGLSESEGDSVSNTHTDYSNDDQDHEKSNLNIKQSMMTDYIDRKKMRNGSKLPKTFPGEPTRPMSSAYLLFSKELLPSLKNMPSSVRMMEVSQRWKAVTAEEKAELQQRVEKQKHKYIKKLQHFKQSLDEDDLETFENIIAARSRTRGKSKIVKEN